MLFLGNAFFSGKYSADPTIVSARNFNFIRISNGLWDEIFISKDPNRDLSTKDWDFDTIFWSKFQNNLSAGNITESIDDITGMLAKRRRVGTFNWVTMFYKPVGGTEDLKFEFFDRYVMNDEEYEYAIVFVSVNIEGSYHINTITPKYSGLFVLDKNKIFMAEIEAYIPHIERNHPIGVVPTINNKYPFTVSNSINNYDSGNVTGIFMNLAEDECDEMDFKGTYKYQKALLDFLANGMPKFLKDSERDVWMIQVSSNPSQSQEINTYKYTIRFDFVEIANHEDNMALLENDFIDIPFEFVSGGGR